MLADETKKENEAAELITELTGYLEKMDAANASTKPTTKTANGEATVTSTDGKYVAGSYQAKVTVTFDSGGKVVSVVDNDTKPGSSNSTYWTNATAMFTKLVGKTASEIDGVDAVSEATVSSTAIKNAVKAALGANN